MHARKLKFHANVHACISNKRPKFQLNISDRNCAINFLVTVLKKTCALYLVAVFVTYTFSNFNRAVARVVCSTLIA